MHTSLTCEHEEAPGFLVNQATRLFARLVDHELRPFGISVAQLPPLLLLAEQGAMLQRDLVRQSATTQPAMVATLSRLAQGGLVSRRDHDSDGRAVVIALTDKGAAAVAQARPALDLGNAQALNGFSAGESALLVGLLRRMIANLRDHPDKHHY